MGDNDRGYISGDKIEDNWRGIHNKMGVFAAFCNYVKSCLVVSILHREIIKSNKSLPTVDLALCREISMIVKKSLPQSKKHLST